MMILLAVLSCCVSLVLSVTYTAQGFYDTRYNHLDIQKILNNKRLVTYYANCITGTGPCTPQGTEFKRILPEILRTNCARCTEKQRVTAYYAIRRLKKEYPPVWIELQKVWDPTGEYVSTFVNTVETNSKSPETPVATEQNVILLNRFGEDENDISSSSLSTKKTSIIPPMTTTSTVPPSVALPLSAGAPSNSNNPEIFSSGTKDISSSSKTTTAATTTTTAATTTTTSTTSPSSTTSTNYRTTSRPNRFGIRLPRPSDFIGSIGDLGSKVIKTGARIADMFLSGLFRRNATF